MDINTTKLKTRCYRLLITSFMLLMIFPVDLKHNYVFAYAFSFPVTFTTRSISTEKVQLHSSNTDGEEARGSNSNIDSVGSRKTRELGSQELLMLPRQYSLSSATFPCMSHVCVSILSSTPSLAAVKAAMEDAIRCHPLLRARVIGNGEPNKRIDLFNMVRDLETKEPNPETFCVVDDNETVDIDEQNMLRVINVANEKELESSWKDSFQYLLDNGPFAKDLLWSMQIHTVDDDTVDRKGNEGSPCALLFVFNHAISDQSSANLLLDHMLTHIENADNIIPAATVVRDIPPSIEESILGKDNLFKQSQFKGGIISSKVLSYVAGKAAEGIKNPVILPDDFTTNNNNNDKSNAVLNAITTITGKVSPGSIFPFSFYILYTFLVLLSKLTKTSMLSTLTTELAQKNKKRKIFSFNCDRLSPIFVYFTISGERRLVAKQQ